MPVKDRAALAALIREALRLSGQRAILQTAWGGRPDEDEPASGLYPALYHLDYAPYRWLFPQTAMVVHHGGSGTTNCGLWAGVPGLVVPFGGDQFYWGARVAALGAGPAPIPWKKLNAGKLAGAISQGVGNAALRDRAARLGEQLRAEDGIAGAIRVIESYMHSPRPRPQA